MLGLKQRFALFIVAGLAIVGVSRQASAKTVVTPYGPADESCVHETPMGGNIDVQSGDVMVNGAVVDHFAPCSVSWQTQLPQKQGGNVIPPGFVGGWYAWSDVQAVSVGGAVRPYDQLGAQWTIPTNPRPPSGDTALEYFFPSLQNNQGLSNNGTGCGSSNNIMIIQPVLQWGNNGSNGGEYWSMASWEVWGCNSDCTTGCSSAHSPYVTTISQGDTIIGTIWQTASNNDAWEIYTDDTTSNYYTWNTVANIPNSWPKFESAQGGVLEDYNVNSSCTDLSPDNSITFDEAGVFEAYPSWNSYYEVDYYGANLLSWGHWYSGRSPNCSWSSAANSTLTTLTWTE